jgi:amino acid transporter
MEQKKRKKSQKLNQFFATAICGNDILSSTFYVSGIAILYAGIYAPLILGAVVVVLFFFKSVYTEVVEALPVNGGAYNCLLNASSKTIAAIAGTMTILSYIATAVLSGKTAIAYLSSLIHLPIIPLTIALLLFFAILVISGIKDSAKVALIIFATHIGILTVFLFLGLIYTFHGHSYLLANLHETSTIATKNGGLMIALFFGFSASLLGVSGFESSANFVEEQDRGVFRKTLRNMLIGVAIFNPLIALIVLNAMPYQAIIHAADFLLSDTAQLIGGGFFKYLIVIDAFLVLSGAVLTAYVGVSGLIYRMTTDGCFPNILAKINKKGSPPYIIGSFFFLCTSILIITKGNLLALAGVYTIAFLSVMSLFAFGNLLMRETRPTLKRTYHAPILFVIIALAATTLGVIGNIRLDPKNFYYFILYFAPTVAIVYLSLKLDTVYLSLLHISHNLGLKETWLQRHFEDVVAGKYVVFVHHIERLYDVLNYINRNEIGRTIYLIHCNNNDKEHYEKSYKHLQETLPHLQKAGVFDHFKLHLLYKNEPFSPELVNKISKELKIRKNRILIGSIHNEHPFDYEALGGVRIIF